MDHPDSQDRNLSYLKHRPSRHGSSVIITRDALWCVLEILLQESACLYLCTPLITLEIREEVRISDIWFVGRVVITLVEHALELV